MKIEIDWTRCDGHGLCARLLPERITLDEWGFPLLPAPRSVRRAGAPRPPYRRGLPPAGPAPGRVCTSYR